MTIKKLPLILITLVLAPEAMATNKSNDIKLEGAVGLLNGSSTELVYEDGKKISQLDWKIKNVPIIKLGAAWDINESWTVKGGLWSAMNNDGDAHMEDRDWLEPNQSSPSDISTHPGTKLRNAYEIDLNTTYWLLNKSNYKVGALTGFQYTQFKWDAIGGTYQYDNGTDVGTFPNNEVGIDYKQEFKVFYLGLAGEYSIDKSDFGAQVKWSPWVDAKDTDNHKFRDEVFYDKSSGHSDFISLSLNYGYNFTPNVKLYAEYAYTIYDEAKADTTQIENDTGDVYHSPNSAGLDNKNSVVSLGLKYNF